MTRPTGGHVRPRGAGELGPGLILVLFGLAGTASTSLWLGGKLVATLTGHREGEGPAWSLLLPITLAKHGGLMAAWPGVSSGAVCGCSALVFILLIGSVGGVGLWVWRHRPTSTARTRSMAKPVELVALRRRAAAVRAARPRPSLARQRPAALAMSDCGVTLGRHLPGHALLLSSWEDVILAIFAPRSGKTSAVAIPAVLNAPGAVVATSNKADLYLATARLREQDTGERVWVFDPQGIAHVRQEWWWNPLGSAMTLDDAERLAGSFVLTVADDQQREIWGPAARELLANLFLAGHLAGKTVPDAYAWLFDEQAAVPVEVLRADGEHAAADSLDGMQALHPETRGSVYFTARAATASLRDRQISSWVTRQSGSVEFDARAFVESRQSLYLMSKGIRGGTTAASLVAALTNEVRVAAERASERNGGRLDPPMLLVLDEVANICRIADLPEQYSHLGSRSIVPIAILQSYAQGERVWGRAGMRELWGAASIN
jgi:type IV secretory pathway TraG/TraD family ATPase VirD4